MQNRCKKKEVQTKQLNSRIGPYCSVHSNTAVAVCIIKMCHNILCVIWWQYSHVSKRIRAWTKMLSVLGTCVDLSKENSTFFPLWNLLRSPENILKAVKSLQLQIETNLFLHLKKTKWRHAWKRYKWLNKALLYCIVKWLKVWAVYDEVTYCLTVLTHGYLFRLVLFVYMYFETFQKTSWPIFQTLYVTSLHYLIS